MAKITAKNAILLVNGYNLSSWGSSYEVPTEIDPVEVTGFGDGSKNYTPGMKSGHIAMDMMWDKDAAAVHAVLKTPSTGIVSLMPEGYALGNPSFSLPYMQANYLPGANVSEHIKVGSIVFESYGVNVGVEHGIALAHATITDTTTGVGVLVGAGTFACYCVLHIWDTVSSDSYVITVEEADTLGGAYTNVATFTLNGQALNAERILVASAARKAYMRAVATRTGAAGDTLGYSVLFAHS